MKVILTAALLLAASALASAQPPGAQQPPAPSITEAKAYLGLTDAQVTALQTIQKQAQAATQSLHTQIQTKQTDLDALLAKGTTDANAVGKLLLDIQTLRKQID